MVAGPPEGAGAARRCRRGLFWLFRRTTPALVTLRTLFGFFEAVRLALDRDDFGAMHEPIDKRHDATSTREDFLPLSKRLVGGNDGAFFLVASVEQFKEQVRVAIRVTQEWRVLDRFPAGFACRLWS